MDDRKKTIEALIKSLQTGGEGNLGTNWGDEIPFNQRLLKARDLSEEALAHEVMKKTGIPIPSNSASILRKEDFYNRVLEEVYPEFDSDLVFNDKIEKGSLGTYDPTDGKIELSPKIAQQDVRKGLATSLHEAAHKYDDKVLKYNMPKSLITGDNAKSQLNLDKAFGRFMDSENLPDASSLYETAAKGHHAKIPDLRDGNSFGMGALKSMLKNGTFKGVAPVLAKAGLATAGGLASLASEASDSEDEGSSAEQGAFLRERDEMVRRGNNMKTADPLKQQALSSIYNELDSGQAFDPRRDALKKISGR